MQHRIFTLSVCLLFTAITKAQGVYFGGANNPRHSLLWQKCLGGTGQDIANAVVLATDGGIVVAGDSKSNDGDVTGHHGSIDFSDGWVVKLHNDTLIEWQLSLGGSANDNLTSIINTSDGGYLCAGFTKSADGDITNNHGNADIWVVKLSANGQLAWSKTYGGSNKDQAVSVLQTSDGGYVVAATTQSTDGDVQPWIRAQDNSEHAWIVKLDSSGQIVWQKTVDQGGTYADRSNKSIGVMETNNNELVFCASGYDTHDTSFVSYYNEEPDTFRFHANLIVGILYKIDLSNGNAEYFTKTGGGQYSYNALMSTDGSNIYISYEGDNMYFLECGGQAAGMPVSYQGFSARVVSKINTETGSFTSTFTDLWPLRPKCPEWINDGYPTRAIYSTGNNGISIMPGGSWIMAGNQTNQDRGGWASSDAMLYTPSFKGIYGGIDVGAGGIEGVGDDVFNAIKALPDGNQFICAGYTGSNSFDVYGVHVPAGVFIGDNYDFWITKISFNPNRITGKVFLDINNNNLIDDGEPVYKRALVKTKKYGTERLFSIGDQGHYEIAADTGSYAIELKLYDNTHFAATPILQTVNFTSANNSDTVDFAVHQISTLRDYTVVLSSNSLARPGFPVHYNITCSNNGTDTFANKEIVFVKDSRLAYGQVFPAPTVISGDTAKWQSINMLPDEKKSIGINLTISAPPIVNLSDTLFSYVLIDSTGDNIPVNNYSLLRHAVSGSYDPNDKAESHAGSITKLEVQRGNYLTYTIRFQNTGNDTAFNVVIRDSLDTKLEHGDFEMVGSSHPYNFKIEKGRYVTWSFTNINLVDSVHNEPSSHGYITYRIKPKTTIAIAERIENDAAIYFDFNLPVKTNTEVTTVIRTKAIWTGAIDTDWGNSNNWNIKEVPDGETEVLVPAGVLNYPVVNSNAECSSIRVDATATVTINTGFNLEVTGK